MFTPCFPPILKKKSSLLSSRFVGFGILGAAVLLTYASALRAGFRLVDDYTNLYRAATMPANQYFLEALDPNLQSIAFRPLGLALLWIEYHLFHLEPSLYHLTQVFLHFANTVLVFELVYRLGYNWRIAFTSAILFAGFPVASEAVFWVSEQSPLATTFSLAAVLFWVLYLQQRRLRYYFLALGLLALAFSSRESAVVVPVIFLFIDWMILQREFNLGKALRRYTAVGLVSAAYLLIEYRIQSHGLHVEVGRYSMGMHVLDNYGEYLSAMALPWMLESRSIHWMFWALVVGASLAVALIKRNWTIAFLVLMLYVTLGPVVFFGLGTTSRYLYMTLIPWSILWALGFEYVRTFKRSRGWTILLSLGLTCLIVLNAYGVSNANAVFSESARQARVPFRDIIRQHPTLPVGTRLFLIEPPNNTPPTEIVGMFFQSYGRTVSVGSTFADGLPSTYGRLRVEQARLRDFALAYVYYFDETNKPIEVQVDREAATQTVPWLPADFQASLRLEEYEITTASPKKSEPLVLILYWRALGQIDRDYTVFVHVLNSKGETVAGFDSQPRSGKEKMSTWKPGYAIADAHLVFIPPQVEPGEYYLELGLYHWPTLERLSILDENQLPAADKLVIGPLNILE